MALQSHTIRFISGICMLWLWCIMSNASLSMAELPRLQHPVKADGSLSFLVVGDWGRRGEFNQSRVASQMGVVGEKLKIDFVVSTGDNFYENGLTGSDDPAFFQSFTNIYTAPSLRKHWYSVLGNHDYRGDVEAQLSPILRGKDDRWICFRSSILDSEIAEFVFVDTTPFVDEYFKDPREHSYDWKEVAPRDKYLSNLLKDVDSALRDSASTSKWRIVVGHHTIKSAGNHGVTLEVEKLLLPILEANNVDFYINGHDHCLEHIISASSGIEFWTSGGGSKAWSGDVQERNPNELKFYYDGQGFLSVDMTQEKVELKFYDVFGSVLHQWSVSKRLGSPAEQPSDNLASQKYDL